MNHLDTPLSIPFALLHETLKLGLTMYIIWVRMDPSNSRLGRQWCKSVVWPQQQNNLIFKPKMAPLLA